MAVGRHCGRTLGPYDLHLTQPVTKLAAKESVGGVVRCAQLFSKAVGAEERDSGLSSIQTPASPYQPDIEVQRSRRMSKTRDRFPLHWDPVSVDLLMERLAKRNDVLVDFGTCIRCSRVGIEPQSHAIEEVKTAEVDESGAVWLFFGSEKDCGREDPLKASDEAAIVRAVLREVKEIEHLSRRSKLNGPALLLQGERGHPDGYQSVLTEGKAVVRMSGDVQEELATVARMD